MDFPISGVHVSPFLLASVGLVVGALAGFFGVGGGFLTGPMLYTLGVPMNFVVGTDLAYMTGKSIIAAKEHRALGHIDFKLGFLMIAGTVLGIEVGAQVIEVLKRLGSIDMVVGVTYVVILVAISGFVAWEAAHALRQAKERVSAEAASGFAAITRRVQRLRLWPLISLPASGIKSISLWAILAVSFATGLLSGMLGVGGGFIRMPALVYLIGVPTHVAVGTDLFEIVVSASYGTLSHAVKGNVDILMALVMQTGAAIGAKLGARLTARVTGPHIRLAFAVLPLIGAGLVLMRLFGGGAPAGGH
ncbi:MAG: sulfite exporter TauE/SafE family protein [Armatimonadota bacterium]